MKVEEYLVKRIEELEYEVRELKQELKSKENANKVMFYFMDNLDGKYSYIVSFNKDHALVVDKQENKDE